MWQYWKWGGSDNHEDKSSQRVNRSDGGKNVVNFFLWKQ